MARIVIAHRPETISSVDKVFEFVDGKIQIPGQFFENVMA